MRDAIQRVAIANRHYGAPGTLIHHSDRDACNEYTELLERNDIQASMSRIANPYDNAKAESFIKTPKYEEVDEFEANLPPRWAPAQQPQRGRDRNDLSPIIVSHRRDAVHLIS